MPFSTLFKVAIGVVIFWAVFAYQNEKLKNLAPSLEAFSQTKEVTGIYTYKQYGRNFITWLDNTQIECSLDYSGGNASCFAHTKDIPRGEKITVAMSLIKMDAENVPYVSAIKFNGKEIYRKAPTDSLKDWWFGSRATKAFLPALLVEAFYLLILFLFFTDRDTMP
ncbi:MULTISPECIES: hypothetical protein [Rhodanobacter]|uniref:DUF3592 domain-containing protein n=1 Tax=Rhodanobacter hydrolyticus TaxID=2250595 RepID=A0ABW8JA10_9GAMM|nr:hypothetical protein [Rhodanobacter sp. 7MK24]MBD8880086.1 hypothetical protein [Rhodanobacter sp. 7MK24]